LQDKDFVERTTLKEVKKRRYELGKQSSGSGKKAQCQTLVNKAMKFVVLYQLGDFLASSSEPLNKTMLYVVSWLAD
jgi:hypothetical protein